MQWYGSSLFEFILPPPTPTPTPTPLSLYLKVFIKKCSYLYKLRAGADVSNTQATPEVLWCQCCCYSPHFFAHDSVSAQATEHLVMKMNFWPTTSPLTFQSILTSVAIILSCSYTLDDCWVWIQVNSSHHSWVTELHVTCRFVSLHWLLSACDWLQQHHMPREIGPVPFFLCALSFAVRLPSCIVWRDFELTHGIVSQNLVSLLLHGT